MAEEREFEVIDKRGGQAASAPAAEPAEPTGEATAGAEAGPEAGGAGAGRGLTEDELRAAIEEAAAAGGGEMPELSVPGALQFCIETLQGLAWIKMGLVAAPGSGKVEQELPQAKIAIDAVSDLVARLNPLVGDSERRDMQTMLQNLRINFVQKSQGA